MCGFLAHLSEGRQLCLELVSLVIRKVMRLKKYVRDKRNGKPNTSAEGLKKLKLEWI